MAPLEAARSLVAEGRLREALALAGPLLGPEPPGPEVWAWLEELLDAAFQERGPRGEEELMAALGLPEDPRAWKAAGVRALESGLPRLALALLARGDEGDPQVLVVRAEACFKGGQLEGAEALLREVLRRDPADSAAHLGLGEVCMAQGRWGDAALHYEGARRRNPSPVLAHLAGSAWFQAGEPERGARAFAAAIEAPERTRDWTDAGLFWLGYNPGVGPEEIHRQTLRLAGAMYPAEALPSEPRWLAPDPSKQLHVGFLGGDFLAHAMARWVHPLLVRHDPQALRITLFSNNPADDEETARLRAHGHGWETVSGLGDEEAARLVRSRDVDVLVDLSGYTAWNRLGVFALRGAPVQVAMLGYRHTTGLGTLDYRWGDPISHPPGPVDGWFTEELVRATGCRMAYQVRAQGPEPTPQPCLSGRPFTFGCLHNPATVNPAMMRRFARILRAAPGSRLRLMLGSPRDEEGHRLRREVLEDEGVNPDRLEFFYRGPAQDYLRQFQELDLCLGTAPFNGGTSICDALWMGVPVLVLDLPGSVCHTPRYLLSQVGLEHWAALGEEDYVRKAAEAAASPEALGAERAGLRERFLRSPLCDLQARARDREAFFRGLWHRWCRQRGTWTGEEGPCD